MNEEIQRRIQEELESIGQMFQSAHVNGEQFVAVASAQFEACQVASSIGMLNSLINGDDKEFAEHITQGALSVMTSIITKVGHGMSLEKFNEAASFGEKVFSRKEELEARLNKMIQGS